MLHQIKIENFGKHADLTVNFTSGINAIRAPNEAGKTTLLRAIGYCFFGSKALTESLEDTVTYGLPVSKLKAELDFSHAGVTYNLHRSKSGAELTAPGITVTGQTEVTKFVEKLFGVSADMASKLMMAKQKALGGALSGGPTAAGKMIEDLAGIDLIDHYIQLIGEKLVAGNTSAAEARVQLCREQAAPADEQDIRPLEAAVAKAKEVWETTTATCERLKAELAEQDVQAADAIVADQKRLLAALQQRHDPILTLKAALVVELPVAPKAKDIAAVRAKVESQKGLAVASKLHAELKALDTQVLWDEPLPTLLAEMERSEKELNQLRTTKSTHQETIAVQKGLLAKIGTDASVLLAQLEGKLIKEESCTFCGKDLKDIPEVALINNPLSAEIAKVQEGARLAETQAAELLHHLVATGKGFDASITQAQEHARTLVGIVARNNEIEKLYARAGSHITLDAGVVPSQWIWTGPTDEPQDFAGELIKLEAAAAAAVAAGARREEQQKQLAALAAAQQIDQDALAALPYHDALETLEVATRIKTWLQTVQVDLQESLRISDEVKGRLSTALALQEQAAKQQKLAAAALVKAEADLAEQQANNALVKKLRDARPKITDQLWAIVLAAVTTYFSDVRGFRSVVTRADNGFQVNGNPVSGLSGSAEDVLGLSIRLALCKTFLPSIDFLMLDEVAAACDDQRETAMLGLLATAGFDQVILVTHSDLCDAYADNLITI